jgi:transcriptional regulator with XRE-family HTH domain
MQTVSEQLRQAIANAPMNRHQIAEKTGIADSVLSRFVRGERGLTLESVDKLAAYFGLELLPSHKPASRKRPSVDSAA